MRLRWIIAKENPLSISHVCLAATAALVSYLIAGLFRLPEAYWAPMSTLIVMQLTFNAALPVEVHTSQELQPALPLGSNRCLR